MAFECLVCHSFDDFGWLREQRIPSAVVFDLRE
jgi:hypothetical protein